LLHPVSWRYCTPRPYRFQPNCAGPPRRLPPFLLAQLSALDFS
jgi:hypothetical protein